MAKYCAHLWGNYYQFSYNKIRVAYNNAFRVLHGIPRCVSDRLHQINVNVTTFVAHIRKYLYRLCRRVELSNNAVIIAIAKSDVLFQSKFHTSFKAKLYSDVG